MAGQPKGAKERLIALEAERKRLHDLLENITTFMDDFESTQVRERSGAFDGYLNRARSLEGQKRTSRDPISKYLDDVKRALE